MSYFYSTKEMDLDFFFCFKENINILYHKKYFKTEFKYILFL